jgi:hypothetical protein
MAADPSAIAAHAQTLRADSDSLAECAVRLGDVARRLRGTDSAPAWFQGAMDEHITRTLIASTDLATAAARLEDYARATAPPSPHDPTGKGA